MQRTAQLQLFGPVALFGAAVAAEACAVALAYMPSSSLLWYLNLEVFSVFRKSRALLGDYCSVPFAQVVLLAGPLALLGAAGAALNKNLMLAVSSNLSLVFAAFLAYSWHAWNGVGKVAAVSLTSVHVPTGSALYLFLTLLIASAISFVVSHFGYVRAVRAEA